MQTNLHDVYRAVVVDTKDPTNGRKIRVKSPNVAGDAMLPWAEPIDPASPVPIAGSIVWVMFSGGYLNKPVYLPTEQPLNWITPTLVTGYTHNGNSEGTVKYTQYEFRGTQYMEWQGGLNVASTGSEGSFAVPNSGTFFTLTDTATIPTTRRTVTLSKNTYSSANYVNNTIKVDFNTDGTCTLIGNVNFDTNWVSLNGVRYAL